MKLVAFLKKFISRGDVSDEWIDKLTSGDCLETFKLAVTHESANPVNNYEQLEFFGDTIMNQAIVWWIKSRHPKIVNLDWLTKIKHLFISTRFVRRIGALLELDKVIVYNPSYFSNNTLDSVEFSKMVEDVVEALLGAVCENFINLGFEHGVGVQVAQNIVWSILDEMNVPITYETIWDPAVVIKEMFDVMRWIFVWNEAITEVKNEKVLSLMWWNEICANDCSFYGKKKSAYIELFFNYYRTNDIYQKVRLDKKFVLMVESFEFDAPVGSANRLPIPVFKKYFGEGEVLVSKRCISENEKVCKYDLSVEAINIMIQNGYKFNNPPNMYSNVKHNKFNNTPQPQNFYSPVEPVQRLAPNAQEFIPRPQPYVPQPQPYVQQQLRVAPQQLRVVPQQPQQTEDLLKAHNIKTMTAYFNWEYGKDKNSELYKAMAREAQRKGWIGGRT